VAQPAGLDYVATVVTDPNNPGGSVQLGTQHGTGADVRVNLGFDLLGDMGKFAVKYWSHEDQAGFSQYDPGDFLLSEQLLPIRFAGAFDTGMADALDAHAVTTVRDLRLTFSRRAFATSRAIGHWSIGLREVDHKRDFSGIYHALVPGLPLVVGREDLDPVADSASVISKFSGRGPDFGFDVQVPMGKRFHFAASVSAAVLRGDVQSIYTSMSRLYAVLPGDTIEQVLGDDLVPFLNEWVLLPEPGENPRPQVLQLAMPEGVVNYSRSTSAQALEGSLSVRYRAWRALEVFAGFRATRYDGVGLEVRPILSETSVIGQVPTSAPGLLGLAVDVPVIGVVESTRSVEYEGFFLGLGSLSEPHVPHHRSRPGRLRWSATRASARDIVSLGVTQDVTVESGRVRLRLQPGPGGPRWRSRSSARSARPWRASPAWWKSRWCGAPLRAAFPPSSASARPWPRQEDWTRDCSPKCATWWQWPRGRAGSGSPRWPSISPWPWPAPGRAPASSTPTSTAPRSRS
jgi:hypothetical protein